jgi:hypothetical protein
VQPKLRVNDPGDLYEKEADTVADQVMRIKNPLLTSLSSTAVQRKCADCEEKENKIQRKETNASEQEHDSSLDNYISGLSGGQSLPDDLRNFYEPKFSYDFSHVKVHTDTAAVKSARSINALAYTSGANIVFNQGQYSPQTDSGKRLLGHELTHVVQQNGGEASIHRKPQPEIKNKCKLGTLTFQEAEINGIKLMVGMATKKLPGLSRLRDIAAQIVEDNKLITDPAFQVKKCIISPNTTRYALFNGQPVLVLDPRHADLANTRHEMGHAISYFLMHNRKHKIKDKAESSNWLATLTDIFLQLQAITIKDRKGEEMTANFIVDPREWNRGAEGEHPTDMDEFFASGKAAFQTNKKVLAALFVKYAKQNSKIGGLGKQLIQALEFSFNTAEFPTDKTVSSDKDIESEIKRVKKPTKLEDTMDLHVETAMLMDPGKRKNCK